MDLTQVVIDVEEYKTLLVYRKSFWLSIGCMIFCTLLFFCMIIGVIHG